jgi:uncharacterized membrane protein YdcZ (DUF606 family)
LAGSARRICGAAYVTTVLTKIPIIAMAAPVAVTVAGRQIEPLLTNRDGWF